MSLQEIKVSREEVLTIVKDNKNKHDQILSEAIKGYWVEAEVHLRKNEKDTLNNIDKNHKEQLKKLRKQRKDAIKILKSRTKEDLDRIKARDKSKGFHYWGNAYPEDHGDDYTGTIRRLELCVEPEVKLDAREFDAYIRNKWEWRNSFLISNTGYVNSWYGTGSLGISSSYAASSTSSSYATTASYALSGSTLLANF